MDNKIYQIVTEKILEKLKAGVVPWKMPWKGGGIPTNFVSKKAYRGINLLLLGMQGYGSNYWLSFKQCKDLGGRVKDNSKATLVIYWKIVEKKIKDEAGEDAVKRFAMLRYYTVFNVEQCEGLKLPENKDVLDFHPNDLCEAVIDGYCDCPEIVSKENQPYYRPSTDQINMPSKENFHSVEGYYASLFHEMIHSTGSKERLNREGFSTHFGSEDYSKEELVAEFGSSFLSGLCGLESTIENSASYIAGWMKKIQENDKWIVCAGALAQKAVDYILGTQFKSEVENG